MGNSITLIIADKFNYCTDVIIKWLKYYKENFLILDPEKKVLINKTSINNQYSDIELDIEGKKVSLKQIKSVIFWKGRIEFELPDIYIENSDEDLAKTLNKFLNRELNTLTQYVYHELNKKIIFGICITKNPNKLIILSLAKEVGLQIPDTIISSSSSQLRKEVSEKSMITKPIQEIFNYRTDNEIYTTFTQQYKTEFIDKNKEEIIFPSLIQRNIEKKYELRIFYFNNNFYTMAIFSQSDDKTSTDFRDYNYNNPTPMIPYILPKKIEIKLKALINKIEYNSCSIDMIVNKKGEHIFLEVNPMGQFDMESIACNYKIEKNIVEALNT